MSADASRGPQNGVIDIEDSDDDSIDIKVDYSALENNAELSI